MGSDLPGTSGNTTEMAPGTAGTGKYWVGLDRTGESCGGLAAGSSHTATAPLHEISPMSRYSFLIANSSFP